MKVVKESEKWRRVDLHIHTPASSDYTEPNVTYLDILYKVESRGLDIIALTDHNTVAGYASLLKEIEELELLERLNRLHAPEKHKIEEYRRLLKEILVLPGFEFTATFGFHILAIFSPQTSVRELEHILLDLKVPPEKLDAGSTEVGPTTDVLTAYHIINEAGGLAIAAHANSAHGVAMRGFGFGGQTKIAYTQDTNLHALEVTDLESSRRRTTASFYNGSKPEYPRRMHCIQGSDAHRLTKDPKDKNALGIGDRVTEILLPEASFEALKAVFLGNDFARTRPYRPTQAPFDYVRAAREQGPNIVQSFHEGLARRGGQLHAIMRDVVAFTNTNGGTIYVGVRANPKTKPVGVENPEEAISTLKAEIHRKINPPLEVGIDTLESEGKTIVRITVPKGSDKPYALENTQIYIRQESETNPAVRDEVVQLVKKSLIEQSLAITSALMELPVEAAPEEEHQKEEEKEGLFRGLFHIEPPRTGVEIIESVERKGIIYHTLMDLRNNNTVNNVTRSSARRLWQYAIAQKEEETSFPENEITWKGEIGFWKSYRRAGKVRYNLAQRDVKGNVHIYYGVTEEGFHGEWKQFLNGE